MKLLNLNTKNLIYLIIFLTPLYLMRFSVFNIPTNILEVLIFITFTMWFIENKNRFQFNKIKITNSIYIFPIAILLSGLVISTIISGNNSHSWGIIKGWFILPMVFSWLVFQKIKTEQEISSILKTIFYSTSVIALISLIYYFTGNLTYDYRLKAFYLSPNYLAMYLSPGLVFGIWYLVFGIKNKKYNSEFWLFAVNCLLLVLILFLTRSHGAWVAVIASLFIAYLISSKKKPLTNYLISSFLFITLCFLFSTFLFSADNNNQSSFSSRLAIWKSSVKILQEHWLFGIGAGNFQEKYLEYQKYFPPYPEWAVPQPHNIFLAFWLQTGIIGLVGFLWIITVWLKNIFIKIKNSSLDKPATVLLAIMLYFLIHGLVDTPYWKNDLAFIFWIILTLGIITCLNNQSVIRYK